MDNKQIIQNLKEHFNGDELAPDVFLKYALYDSDENILETHPDQMHRRLAKEFARIEAKYPNPLSEQEIYSHLKDFGDIVPQGSPMSGIGNRYRLQSLSNCFIIDQPYDSYGGILHADQEQVQIMKRRGGVGIDVSTIRPKNQKTSNAARTTDGIGVFMERFSNSTREVAQGGRRGALMQTIDCRHPEIETFIKIKNNKDKVTGANISIRFTDEFMHAVENNEEFVLRWPVEASVEDAIVTKTVSAKKIWDNFIDSSWEFAEPSALFWDTIIKNGIVDCYSDVGYKTISTNPCVSGNTLVETNAGLKTVKELSDNKANFLVKSYNTETLNVEMKRAIAFKTKENAKVLKITTKSGKQIILTPDHRVYTDQGWVEAKDLTKNHKILGI